MSRGRRVLIKTSVLLFEADLGTAETMCNQCGYNVCQLSLITVSIEAKELKSYADRYKAVGQLLKLASKSIK